jgi:hypothetical protein
VWVATFLGFGRTAELMAHGLTSDMSVVAAGRGKLTVIIVDHHDLL